MSSLTCVTYSGTVSLVMRSVRRVFLVLISCLVIADGLITYRSEKRESILVRLKSLPRKARLAKGSNRDSISVGMRIARGR